MTQMLAGMFPIPGINWHDLAALPPMRNLVSWTGANLLRIAHPITNTSTGSGDRTADWVVVLVLLVIAIIVTAIWTIAAKARTHYGRSFTWFRLFIRLALATTMLSYGWVKLIPLQMPILDLHRLVQPYGTLSPMGVLWSFVGSSPTYEIFIGSIEVTSGLLLFWPRTVVIGAMMCLMDAVQIFSLNMMYDVPVKLFAFHLILISLVLLAPNLSRLYEFLILHRNSALRTEPPIGRTPARRRNALIAQLTYGLVVAGLVGFGAVRGWTLYGGGAPRSPLFGIWNVDQMAVDGEVRPPLLTDSTRWRRVVIQNARALRFQRMNDTFGSYGATIDSIHQTVLLTSLDSTKTKSSLTYQRPTNERLLIDGTLDGHPVHMELTFVDPDSFQQRSRGFHLVSEFPFNR
jgi:hypothetical protein